MVGSFMPGKSSQGENESFVEAIHLNAYSTVTRKISYNSKGGYKNNQWKPIHCVQLGSPNTEVKHKEPLLQRPKDNAKDIEATKTVA